MLSRDDVVLWMRDAASRILELVVAALCLAGVLVIVPFQSVSITNGSTGAFSDVVVRSECDSSRVVELRPGDSLRHWIGWCGRDSTSYVEFTLEGTRYRGTAGYFGKIASTTLNLHVTNDVATVRSGMLLPSAARAESFSLARWSAGPEPNVPELPLR